MKELYVFCEGPTEQGFCQRVLQPELFPQHDGLVHPVKIAHSRRRGVIHRGGVSTYARLRNDVVRQFRQHQREGVLFTSLIDLYGLPNITSRPDEFGAESLFLTNKGILSCNAGK